MGIEQGRLNTINTIADLVKGGFLTKELGAQKLNLSIQEFETYLQEEKRMYEEVTRKQDH